MRLLLILWLALGITPAYAGITFQSLSSSPVRFTHLDTQGGARVISSLSNLNYDFSAPRQVRWDDKRGWILSRNLDEWQYTDSGIDLYEKNLKFKIKDYLEKLRSKQDTLNLFDWGAGQGQFLKEIREYAQSLGFKKIQISGLSNMAFPAWKHLTPDITIYLENGWWMGRHTHSQEFDLIVSHKGLGHMIYTDEYTAPKYLGQLFDSLKPGGMFVTDFSVENFIPQLDEIGVSRPFDDANVYFRKVPYKMDAGRLNELQMNIEVSVARSTMAEIERLLEINAPRGDIQKKYTDLKRTFNTLTYKPFRTEVEVATLPPAWDFEESLMHSDTDRSGGASSRYQEMALKSFGEIKAKFNRAADMFMSSSPVGASVRARSEVIAYCP